MSEDGHKDTGDELLAGLNEIASLTEAGDYPEAQSVCQRLLQEHPTSVALHELGHSVVAQAKGSHIQEIVLYLSPALLVVHARPRSADNL